MKRLILLFSIFICLKLLTASKPTQNPLQIIPAPAELTLSKGQFFLRGDINLVYEPGLKDLAQFLKAHLQGARQVNVLLFEGDIYPSRARTIVLKTDHSLDNHEKYTLHITNRSITIAGGGAQGVFYGLQSLRQLLPPELEEPGQVYNRRISIPCLEITDYPAFGYRGMHLDVARHFFPVSFIKKYIDLLALHKMNTFHWHLTEDQGWRIEIKKYPLLTEVGAWREKTLVGHVGRPPLKYDNTPYGGFYTQEEIREIVEYARERYIRVIPEIEMPGHALAALAAYPQLGCTGGPYKVAPHWGVFEEVFCAGNDQVFEFLEDVLLEVLDLFPSGFIHIGGDECPKTSWRACPKCQERIAVEGLKDEYELQSYFIRRIETFLLTRGRNIIGWDEILEGGLAPQATVMSWRGTQGGIEAARMGHQVIMTPVSHCYFDYYQAERHTQPLAIGGFLPLEKVYSYKPVPEELSEEEAKLILGAQGNVWTEYMKTPEHVEYMAFPRAIALAEVLWTPAENKNFEDFIRRLKRHFLRLDALDVNYFAGN